MRKNQEVGNEHYVAVGKILSPWGLKGEVKFELYYPDSEVLFETRQAYLKAGFLFKKAGLQSVRRHGKFLRIHLEGVNSPENAKVFNGLELFIPSHTLPATETEEYYVFEMVGMEVSTINGKILGTVKEVAHYGASPLLVVQNKEENKEIMIPLIPDFLREISLDERKVVVEGVEELIG